jgi:hypothetical protein
MSDRSPSAASMAPVKARLLQLLDEVIAHDGYGSIKVDVRLLKKGQKEVIVDCGKQYRFVVDHPGFGSGVHEAA